MNWTMPPRILQIVAVVIGLCAVAGFVGGLNASAGRGRLPGEAGPGGIGAALVAADARPVKVLPPLPPPAPLAPDPEAEAKAKAAAEAEKLKLAQARTSEKAAAAKAVEPAAPPADKVGDLLDAVTPPPAEDPPF